MNTQTRIETISRNEAASNAFHLLTLAALGLFSLTAALQFLSVAVI